MSKQVTITVYRFSELSREAKDKVKEESGKLWGYSWGLEALSTMRELAHHFDAKIFNFSVDWFGISPSYMRFDTPNLQKEEIKSKLSELEEESLTGVFTDGEAIDGFRKAFNSGESDLANLMQAAFKSLLKACQDDCEYQHSDDGFSETSDASDYWYFSNGNLFVEEKK